mmetsp:Transcript_10282/g.30329  ORF Transcript_10282/g.30329 Transcript_10282/m.30329 type:complete len:201 (-) Transcript_10282:960-1562(-)
MEGDAIQGYTGVLHLFAQRQDSLPVPILHSRKHARVIGCLGRLDAISVFTGCHFLQHFFCRLSILLHRESMDQGCVRICDRPRSLGLHRCQHVLRYIHVPGLGVRYHDNGVQVRSRFLGNTVGGRTEAPVEDAPSEAELAFLEAESNDLEKCQGRSAGAVIFRPLVRSRPHVGIIGSVITGIPNFRWIISHVWGRMAVTR